MKRDEAKKVKFLVNGKLSVLWDDGVYKSVIGDVTEKYIAMSIPVNSGKYLPFSHGEKIEVVYYYENELYKFYSTVVGRKVDGVPLILFSIPSKLEKYQRRNFVRIPCINDVEFQMVAVKHNNSENLVEKNVCKGILIDISAGGMKLLTKEDIKVGDTLFVNLNLVLDEEEIKVKGKVVTHSINVDKKNMCGIVFLDLDIKDREKIVKFTFLKMRELRKKGLKEG